MEEIAEELVGCVRSYADHKKVVAAALRAERTARQLFTNQLGVDLLRTEGQLRDVVAALQFERDRAEKAESRIRELEQLNGNADALIKAQADEIASLRRRVVEVLGPLLEKAKTRLSLIHLCEAAALLRELSEASEPSFGTQAVDAWRASVDKSTERFKGYSKTERAEFARIAKEASEKGQP